MITAAAIRGRRPIRPARRFVSAVAVLCALLAVAVPATASAAPAWDLRAFSDTAVAPGASHQFLVEVANVGDTQVEGVPLTFTAAIPPGLTATAVTPSDGWIDCAVQPGGSEAVCEGTPEFAAHGFRFVRITAEADLAAEGTLTAAFSVEGGGAAAKTVDPVQIGAEPSPFGIDAFDSRVTDPAGATFAPGGAIPAHQLTDIDFNLHTDPHPLLGFRRPVEDVRDVTVELPPGLIGNPAGLPECTTGELASGPALAPAALCPAESQLGVTSIRMNSGTLGPIPVFNMVPPRDVPARFGFNVIGVVVVLDADVVRDGPGYRIVVRSSNVSQALNLAGSSFDFWGIPASSAHDSERACPGTPAPWQGLPGCASPAQPRAFLRTPTSCTGPLQTDIRADSWQDSGDFDAASVRSHEAPGYPYPSGPSVFPDGYSGPESWGPEVGIEGCDQVPFEPTISVEPTTNRADSPTGLTVDLGLPDDCWAPMETAGDVEAAICQSDMRSARTTFPPGLFLNPSAASGRQACTADQAGVISPLGQTPVEFDEAPVTCPDASKLGDVEIATPILDEPLTGALYLAEQDENPFRSLLATYLVAEGSGVLIKQAGQIELTDSGQLTTTFAETPQTPFSNIHLELYGGPRAALRTPPVCGTHTTTASLSPWSGNGSVQRQSSFQITENCGGGFDPKLDAGTENPLAGAFSPFHLRLSREDGSQELGGLSIDLPPGLLGSLKGYSYCSDAALAAVSAALGTGRSEEEAPSCPASSRVGTVTAGAGAGPTPFFARSGRAYLAGPYKGAPVSLAVIVPAVAGPFDLGAVLVRNAIQVDPITTRLTVVSDPLPRILHGIPLALRDVRVNYEQTLNPTSCDPMTVDAILTSTQGVRVGRSNHFQAANCDRLGFKPRLSLRLSGGSKRSQHPALTAVMRPRLGNANARRIRVTLPRSEFLAQSHIRTICTRVQFAADECPKGSIYGRVTATSPILGYYLSGNIYLRSSNNPLPDMVLKLRGPASQPIEVNAVGRIDSKKGGGIRTTFAGLPDAPLSKVVLRFPGGRKSLLENSVNLCRRPHRAIVQMDGQNGKLHDMRPKMKIACGKKKARQKNPGRY